MSKRALKIMREEYDVDKDENIEIPERFMLTFNALQNYETANEGRSLMKDYSVANRSVLRLSQIQEEISTEGDLDPETAFKKTEKLLDEIENIRDETQAFMKSAFAALWINISNGGISQDFTDYEYAFNSEWIADITQSENALNQLGIIIGFRR